MYVRVYTYVRTHVRARAYAVNRVYVHTRVRYGIRIERRYTDARKRESNEYTRSRPLIRAHARAPARACAHLCSRRDILHVYTNS